MLHASNITYYYSSVPRSQFRYPRAGSSAIRRPYIRRSACVCFVVRCAIFLWFESCTCFSTTTAPIYRPACSSKIHTYYKCAAVIAIVFDVSNRETFDSLENLYKRAKEHGSEGIELLLIGNKNDLPNRQVSYEEAEAWALQHNMCYLDFSAMNGHHVTLESKIREVIDKRFI